jgi:hypothetical protein
MFIPYQLHQLQKRVRKKIHCPSSNFGGKIHQAG